MTCMNTFTSSDALLLEKSLACLESIVSRSLYMPSVHLFSVPNKVGELLIEHQLAFPLPHACSKASSKSSLAHLVKVSNEALSYALAGASKLLPKY